MVVVAKYGPSSPNAWISIPGFTHTQKKNSLLCANNAIFMNYQSFKTKELINSIMLAKMFDAFFPKFLPGKQKINPNKSSSLNYLNNVVHS